MKSTYIISLLLAGALLTGCQLNDTTQQSSYTTTTPNSGSSTTAHTQEGVKTSQGNGGEKETKVVEPDGWYMRTIVTATTPSGKRYRHASAGIFGELKESSDGLDKHDINAFGRATLYVIFPRVVNNKVADYFSDYHHYDPTDQGDSQRQSWTFQVKNESGADLSHATINLQIEGPFKVYKQNFGYKEEPMTDSEMFHRLSLFDMDNEEVYPYSELKNVHLTMEGKKVRTFRWILGDVIVDNQYTEETEKIMKQTAQLSTTRMARAVAQEAPVSTVPQQSGEKRKTFGFPPRL